MVIDDYGQKKYRKGYDVPSCLMVIRLFLLGRDGILELVTDGVVAHAHRDHFSFRIVDGEYFAHRAVAIVEGIGMYGAAASVLGRGANGYTSLGPSICFVDGDFNGVVIRWGGNKGPGGSTEDGSVFCIAWQVQ